MKRSLSAALIVLPCAALAHPSIMPHDHPHGISWLPDVGVLMLAAALVAAGVISFRFFKRMTR